MQRLGPRAYLVMEKKIFKVFTIYGHGSHFDQWTLPILAIFHSPAHGGSAWNLSKHWAGGFRGKAIWNYQHFFHTNVWGPYKCIQKQTWPRHRKIKCQCMTIIFATLVDRPFQMIYAKIQPQAILGLMTGALRVKTHQQVVQLTCSNVRTRNDPNT